MAREAAAARVKVPPPQVWFSGLERWRSHISDSIGRECILRAESPGKAPKLHGTPWALVARLSGFDGQLTYDRLWNALAEIDQDRKIIKAIHPRRLCRLVALYEGPSERGGTRMVKRDWTIAEISPYDVMLSRALERLDPGLGDSIAAGYGEAARKPTKVVSLYVWISVDKAKVVSP